MQQERSFLRRVCVLKPFIYENCPSSRRAYFSIRLAVKTSRPHLFKYSVFSVSIKDTDYFIVQRYTNLFQFPMLHTEYSKLNTDHYFTRHST